MRARSEREAPLSPSEVKVQRPSRPPSRKYEQHRKLAPPTYKTKLLPVHRTRDPSTLRKRPYPVQKPTAPIRKAVPLQEQRKTAVAKLVPAKTVAQTSKGTVNTSKAVEKSNIEDVKMADDSKKGVDLLDFDDDLDVKGLREEPTSEGHYELNPLMSRVLEKELQTIMIKVWQDLPDKPPTAAEKAVVDKLRTEAGDDLKNVLGLNVSKRLLNVHNPLYVKVSLSRKPDRVSLKEFVQTYNCIGLKYVASQSQQHYTFVAQFKHFADLDRICSTKIVRCGNERVSIVPCYKFTTCPPHLKSIYSDNGSQSKESQIDKGNNENKTAVRGTDNKGNDSIKTEVDKTATQKAIETKVDTTAVTKNANTNQIKKESDEVNKETKTAGIAKPINKVEAQATKNIGNQAKIAEVKVTPTKAPEKAQAAKVISTTQQVAKSQLQTTTAAKTQAGNAALAQKQPTKTTPAKPQPEKATSAKAQPQTRAKTEPQTTTANTQAENATPAKAQTTTLKTQLEKAAPAKTQPGKTPPVETPQKAQPQKPTPTKVAQKPTPQKATNNKDAPKVIAKPNVTNKKPITKSPRGNTKKNTADEDITAKISEMIAIDEVYDDYQSQQDDEDVLDDEDILALMSGAIVLDECRGSDEE